MQDTSYLHAQQHKCLPAFLLSKEAVVVEESQEAVDTADSNVEEEKNEDSNIVSSTEEDVTDSSDEEDKSEDK